MIEVVGSAKMSLRAREKYQCVEVVSEKNLLKKCRSVKMFPVV